MTDYLSRPIIRDPVQRKLISEKDQALDEYVANYQAFGEQDSRTQMKLILYVLRTYMVTIREQVQGLKGILMDFNALSQEIDSIFNIEYESTNRFKRGLEKYPVFMQNWIAHRRAKKYYNKKIADMKFMLRDIQDKLAILPEFMTAFSSAISGLTKSLGKSMTIDTSGKGKKGALVLTPEMQKELDARIKGGAGDGSTGGDKPAGGSTGGSDDKPAGGSTGGGSTGGSTGGGSGSGRDKWDEIDG